MTTGTPLPKSSNFFYDYTPSFETAQAWVTDNFVTRGCSSLAGKGSNAFNTAAGIAKDNIITRGLSSLKDGIYNAEEAIGDGIAHYTSSAYTYAGEKAANCSSAVYEYTVGETGYLTHMTRAAGRSFSAAGQFIYEHSPSIPESVKNNRFVNTLYDTAGTAGEYAHSTKTFIVGEEDGNFITRGWTWFAGKAYSAEESIGDGVVHFGNLVHDYTFGVTGFFTSITRASAEKIASMGQAGSGYLNSTRTYIYESSPTIPTFMKNNSAVNMLSGAAEAAGTTFSGWVSHITDFFSSSGTTLSSTGQFIGGYGESIYSFFLALGNKIQSAHQSGSLYKIAPLALGSIFAYFGLKNLARGTVGYDSLAIRKKMAHKALHEKDLSFGTRIALVRDSFFGTMPGQRRAAILARSIASLVVSALLIYPFFVKSPSPNADLENMESNNFRDQYLDSAASLDPRAMEAHRLHTASQMYLPEKEKYDRAFSKAKIDPRIQCFVEEALNPIPQGAGTTSTKSMKQTAYDWTIGQTKGFFAPCRNFATPGHQTIFSESEDGMTRVNTTRLQEVCDARKAFIAESPKPLGIQFSDFVGAACNATVGYTPWAGLCSSTREALGKSIEQDRYVMSTAVTTMCDALSKRGASNINLQREFAAFPPTLSKEEAKDPQRTATSEQELIKALKQRGQDAQSLGDLAKKEAEFEEFVKANGPEVGRYMKGFFNISDASELNAQAMKKAYKALSLKVHPDKCRSLEDAVQKDCEQIFSTSAHLYETFKNNPKLFEACTGNASSLASSGDHNYFYTTREMWQNLKDAFNPYSDVPANPEENPDFHAEPCVSQRYIDMMLKTCRAKAS